MMQFFVAVSVVLAVLGFAGLYMGIRAQDGDLIKPFLTVILADVAYVTVGLIVLEVIRITQ